MAKFFSLTIYEFINHYKVTFLSARICPNFPTSLGKHNMCASLWFRVRERPEKCLLLSPWRRELYGPGSHFFLFDRHEYIHTANLPVCSSGQHTYAMGLFNFFFDWQNRFLFSESSFSEELVSYWLLTLYVTSFSQCK